MLISVSLWETTDTVLAQGLRIAEACHSTVWLLHVLKTPGLGTARKPPPELRDEKERELRDLRRELESRRAALAARGLDARALVVEGADPAQMILEQARVAQADLIVMGAHGRGAIYGVLLGDVAHDVLRHAACPVLIVPMRMLKTKGAPAPEAN